MNLRKLSAVPKAENLSFFVKTMFNFWQFVPSLYEKNRQIQNSSLPKEELTDVTITINL